MSEVETDAHSTEEDTDAEKPFAAGNANELLDFEFPKRRRWPVLVVGVALGVGGTFAGMEFLEKDDSGNSGAAEVEVQLATAPVEIRDLIEEVEWIADLGYGEPVDVEAPADGTVTATAAVGELLSRGDALFEIDDDPVVLFYGDIPAWRDLTTDEEGPDVEQMEANLVILGYDPDDTVTIDRTYTTNTGLMVERWQQDLGIEVTGEFSTSNVLVVPGPVAVASVPAVGQSARSGTSLAGLSTRARITTIVGNQLGAITSLLASGDMVEHGAILYTADGIDVMALTSLDIFGELLVDPDTDPLDLEGALGLGGYDPDGEMVIDDTYDEATSAAVARWQEATGLPATGDTSSDAYIVVDPDLQVAQRLVDPGDSLAVARPVLELTAPTLSVVIPVVLADQDDFVVGQQLQVELPDESVVSGVVIDVGAVAQTAAPGEDSTIDVIVEITDVVDEDLPASEVTVLVAGESVENAMVVPTRALVTLSEGGFAVEKMLDDGTTVLIAVETGTFADGVVEVETSQLEAGDELVVPQ